MCQLTLLDIDPKTKLSNFVARILTEFNSEDGITKNRDGFGYMTFSKAPSITKSVYSAEEWWKENSETFYKSVRNANGIYHVRAASVRGGTIYGKDAHPFHHGHIVLAHNGTLIEQDKLKDDKELQKLFPDAQLLNAKNIIESVPMIDSERFCVLLAKECGNDKLTAEHIRKTMEYFYGPFAFLIYDTKQPKKVFIVRGSTKKLNLATIWTNNKKTKIGVIVNTGRDELFKIAKIIKTAAKLFLNMRVDISVEEILPNGIYEYILGSYELPKETASIYENKRAYDRHVNTNKFLPGVSNEYSHKDDTIKNILDFSSETALTLKELFILSEIIMGKSLLVSSFDEIKEFYEILRKLKQDGIKGRYKVWINFRNSAKLSPLNAYKALGIEFPYILNSKKEIIKAVKRSKGVM